MTALRSVSSLRSLLDLFPLPSEISYCFAYGSAIFEQKLGCAAAESTTDVNPQNPRSHMIDLVIAVNDPLIWHQENLQRNRSHYSGLGYFGPKLICKIQENFGAKIFYNTLIPIGNDYMKYGVISTKDLINDLLDWETYYVSARLQKPTLTLKRDQDNRELCSALKLNLQSALHAALLLQSEKFTEKQLYLTIAGLSYGGDFRMIVGEDRHKVEKLVGPQMENYRKIYSPLMNGELLKDLVKWSPKLDCFVQNCSTNAIQWHLNLLPKTVQFNLTKHWLNANRNASNNRLKKSANSFDIDDMMGRLAYDIDYRQYVRRSIDSIVWRSSWTQSLKGIFTAGLSKSVIYSNEKISKMVNSYRQ